MKLSRQKTYMYAVVNRHSWKNFCGSKNKNFGEYSVWALMWSLKVEEAPEERWCTDSCICGFHIYKEMWGPEEGEMLQYTDKLMTGMQ